jgi:tRNA(His) guanylyltransferase
VNHRNLYDLGDRMKAYEDASETRLNRGTPTIARLDGRSFSRFTRDLAKPFDERMSEAMMAVTRTLVEKTHAVIGYTQSDEVSIVMAPNEEQSFFDGRVQKIASVLAGMATGAFIRALMERGMDRYVERDPHFDCRVYQVPSAAEAANALLWRVRDATKNAITMAAGSKFPHKALHGVSGEEKIRMLRDEHGVEFASLPSYFRNGSFWKRFVIERLLSEEEWLRIPERHRPDPATMVLRSEVRRVEMPELIRFHDIEQALK